MRLAVEDWFYLKTASLPQTLQQMVSGVRDCVAVLAITAWRTGILQIAGSLRISKTFAIAPNLN
jgi:PIN domain nuclease of toxin-antitoxin system